MLDLQTEFNSDIDDEDSDDDDEPLLNLIADHFDVIDEDFAPDQPLLHWLFILELLSKKIWKCIGQLTMCSTILFQEKLCPEKTSSTYFHSFILCNNADYVADYKGQPG